MDLLQTKLRMPPVRREHVPRPRLHALLRGAAGSRLTLLSAPAGFGKTSLLTEWLSELDLPLAWLSLDEKDNAWPRLLAYILTALQSVEPSLGTGLLGALESPEPPSFDPCLSALQRDLAVMQRPFVLVMDDFHVLVDPEAHELLTYLIDNQPPGMQLVLAGRSDPPWPLARLRAAGALAEIRAADLRFTDEETCVLLNDTLGLGLSQEDLSSLAGRTEGWVAGLHLAALSLKNTADRHAFIQAFAGSDRFVLDYLMEEVLAQQPEDISTFLLQTSLLDRFNGALCDHVAQRTDSQAMLRRLEAANLFVIPLDSERLWFAYHSLMRSFLRSVQKQRDPEGLVGLHARASEWYEANADVLDAIQHALAAGDHQRVGRLVRTSSLSLVLQGDLPTVLAWLHDPRGARPQIGPWLRIAQLWAHSFSGDETVIGEEVGETRELIREGLRALEDTPDTAKVTEMREALAHLTAVEANLAVFDGRHAEAARLAREAVNGLPARDSTTRRYSYVCLGMAQRHLGELSTALETLAHADAAGDDAEQIPAPARGLATRAGIQIWMGQLDEAEATCRRILALHDEHLRRCGRRPPIATFGYARLSEVMRQRNHIEEALGLAQESCRLANDWQLIDALFESSTHLARALQASGDPAAAMAALHRLEYTMRDRSPWLLSMTRMESARACLALPQNEDCIERARAWAKENPLPADRQLVFRDHAPYLTHARIILHEAQADRNRAPAGRDLTRRILQLLEPTGARGLHLEASLLCALFDTLMGEADQALRRVEACLQEAEPQGYVRLFLDQGAAMDALLSRIPGSSPAYAYAQELLRASAARPPTLAAAPAHGQPLMPEPLSDRELDVLRLLATTLSGSEIADQLFVATSTVRSHTKTIYGKLGVHSRLEAVEQARLLGLI